jgi:lysophospholipase L1-like esterase
VMFARQVRGWSEWMADPRHCFVRSSDPTLVFELKPGVNGVFEGNSLRINSHGIRDDSDDLYKDQRRIALLGDSVTFSTSVNQEESVAARLQQLLDPGVEKIKVLNFGCSGYSIFEMPSHLNRLAKIYKPEEIIYLLNPNDFSERDTVYEGADGGLYRMYVHPTFKLPAAIKKVVYRQHKGGGLVSAQWYAWMYNGTKSRAFPKLIEMRDEAKKMGAQFRVLMLPTFTTTQPDGPAVKQMYREIADFARANGIPFADASDFYAPHIKEWLDESDHNTAAGNQGLAEAIKALVIDNPPAKQ